MNELCCLSIPSITLFIKTYMSSDCLNFFILSISTVIFSIYINNILSLVVIDGFNSGEIRLINITVIY